MIMSSIIVTFRRSTFRDTRFSFATRSRTLLYLPLVALRGNLLYRASHTHSHFCTYNINHMSFFFSLALAGSIVRGVAGTGSIEFCLAWISRSGFVLILPEAIPPRPERPEWNFREHRAKTKAQIFLSRSKTKSDFSQPLFQVAMYRTSSPIFDVPEFPPLRRVKPLPKRKRIHPPSESDYDFGGTDDYPTTATVASRATATAQPRRSSTTPSLQTPLSGRKDGGTSPHEKDEAQADRISARLDYYKATILGDPLPHPTERQHDDDDNSHRKKIAAQEAAGVHSIYDIPLAAFGIFVPGVNTRPVADDSEGADEDRGEGDYVDHLQQHGNTKKRKVPANMSAGGRHGHRGDAGSGDNSGADDDDGQDGFGGSGGLGEISRGIPTGRPFEEDHPSESGDQGPFSSSSTSSSTLSLLPGRKPKMSAATRAGLQHKEVLKSRKKQLAAVLGALSHGDALALDQALSARYPYGLPGELKGALVPPKTRLSKRKEACVLRELRAKNLNRENTNSGFPSREFSFVYESASE